MPPVNVVVVLVHIEVAVPLVFPAITGFTVPVIAVLTVLAPVLAAVIFPEGEPEAVLFIRI